MGLEAQQAAVVSFVGTQSGTVMKQYVEVESGKNTDRPELAKAKQCLEQSLRFTPNQPMQMVRLGLIVQKEGDLPEAVRQFSHAYALEHSDLQGLLLAQALRQQGRVDEANAIAGRVARTSKNLAAAQKAVESLLSGK